MALNGLYCADVPLSNYLRLRFSFLILALYKSTYLLTHSLTHSPIIK